jgi:hypothetical protein
MKYLNATQAAQRLGVSDKTMRRWLKEEKFKLHAIRTSSNELMLAESEIERVKRERAEYASQEADPEAESVLVERIEDLERQVDELRAEVLQIRSYENAPTWPVNTSASQTLTSYHKPVRVTTDAKNALPDGAVLARHFAASYDVAPGTFRGHYENGLGFDHEKAPISSRPDPSRGDGKMQWYVMPGQVDQLLDYWRKYHVRFKDPIEAQS